MATTGQIYPTAALSVAETPWDDQEWGAAASIYADDGNAANITGPTFDDTRQSQVLKAYTFNFSNFPLMAVIEGVICRVNAWYANGSVSVDLLQLLNTSQAKVGTNQCATPVALTTTNTTIITKGSSSDLWGNVLTPAWVKNVNFGVAIGVVATANDADVFVDYVTLEIYYTMAGGFFQMF